MADLVRSGTCRESIIYLRCYDSDFIPQSWSKLFSDFSENQLSQAGTLWSLQNIYWNRGWDSLVPKNPTLYWLERELIVYMRPLHSSFLPQPKVERGYSVAFFKTDSEIAMDHSTTLRMLQKDSEIDVNRPIRCVLWPSWREGINRWPASPKPAPVSLLQRAQVLVTALQQAIVAHERETVRSSEQKPQETQETQVRPDELPPASLLRNMSDVPRFEEDELMSVSNRFLHNQELRRRRGAGPLVKTVACP